MKASTTTSSSNITETDHNLAATLDGQDDNNTLRDTKSQTGRETANKGKPESELCAAARRQGLTLKELARRMGVNYGHLCSVGNGHRPWSPMLRERVMAVLGEVPGQGVVYRQRGVVEGRESTYIRERARERGLSMNELAQQVGISSKHLTDISRGRNQMSPGVEARLEPALGGPVKVEPAERADVDPRALWERMDAHGWSQNETASRAGISNGYLSDVMAGRRTPSGDVLRRLHGVLFAPSAAELVAPVELKVLAWKKGGRNGMVIRGADGPGGDSIRVGGKVPWGAEVQFAYTTGYDRHGRVSVNRVVGERDCSVMLKQREAEGV